MSYTIRISKLADIHITQIKKSGDKSSLKRLQSIVDELIENPCVGKGDPKPLKYELAGLWSRKINMKDRLIYEIDEDSQIVNIISLIGHYSDK